MKLFSLISLVAITSLVRLTFVGVSDDTTSLVTLLSEDKTAIEDNALTLSVFYQSSDALFQAKTLPQIMTYCAQKNINIVVRDAKDGVPEGITTTPAIVFQTAKGRSIYAARYTEFSTIQNFIRTNRAIAQSAVDNCKKDIMCLKYGRANIVAPLKITEMTGKVLTNFDQAEFQKAAVKSVQTAMRGFQYQSDICLRKTDRAFYLDIYPYLGKDDSLYLTVAIFSQFNCIVPTFTNQDQPIKGKLSDCDALFALAAICYEIEVTRQLKEATNGDAVSPITENIPVVTWESLGLPLTNQQGIGTNMTERNTLLSSRWVYAGAIDTEIPMMQFNFMSPLDRYAGEVKGIKGNLELNEQQVIQKGDFEVATESLTMGIEDFDHKVHKAYLKVKKFPKATFKFQKTEMELKAGKTTTGEITGIFELMGIQKKLTMQAQITPTTGSKGEQLLAVQATFALNITDDFGIKGPDGPSPANKTMQFTMNFFMQ